jgi:hypothetical protein
VQSEPGVGSTFSVILADAPLAPTASETRSVPAHVGS